MSPATHQNRTDGVGSDGPVPAAGNHSEFQSNPAPVAGIPMEEHYGRRSIVSLERRRPREIHRQHKKVQAHTGKARSGSSCRQISTGPHAGQWVATARSADWESFGKGVQGLLNDPSYLKLVGEMAETFKLENRTIITGIDL